jgi:hypothetical protein
MNDEDVEFICRCVEFLAEHGERFLDRYRLDLPTGSWSHLEDPPAGECRVGLAAAMGEVPEPSAPPAPHALRAERARYLAAAREAALAGREIVRRGLPGELDALRYFDVMHLEA